MRWIFFCFFAALLFNACKRKIETVKDINRYLAEPSNGLIAKDSIGKLEVCVAYKPLDILKSANFSKDYQKGENFGKKYYYFTLSLSAGQKEFLHQLRFDHYSALIQRFSFDMNSYIKAESGSEVNITPEYCELLQTYGAGAANNLLVVFKRSAFKGDDLCLNIKEFGLGTGDLLFHFNRSAIRKLEDLTS